MAEITNPQTQSGPSGQSAGDLAHDISNLLLVVTWSSRQLLVQLAEDHPHRSLLQAIYDSGTQAAQLSRHLQDLVEVSTSDTVELDNSQQQGGSQLHQFAGTETILLVEDDPQILDLLKWRLERCGYNVLAAQRGADAIAIALDHSDCIHLLVTDLLMPDLSGREVAETLRQHYPGLPALFLSGQPLEQATGGNDAEDSFLQKPFKARELMVVVRDIIDRSIQIS